MKQSPSDAPEPDGPVVWLSSTLEVDVTGTMPALAPSIEAEITAPWDRVQAERARAGRSALFNGCVFCADCITPDRITGHWTEYRRVLAQMQNASMFNVLRIRSLAVTGLLQCADGLLLGRREAGSVYQAGTWQSPPAGTVERRPAGGQGGPKNDDTTIDLAGQILAECEEELGLPADRVQVLAPVAAIEHPISHIVDVGFLLRTALTGQGVEQLWRAHGNQEYDQLRHIGFDEVATILAGSGIKLLPTTRHLLAFWLQQED